MLYQSIKHSTASRVLNSTYRMLIRIYKAIIFCIISSIQPTFDSLFPSIYKSSIEGDTKFPHTDACVLNQTQDHAIQLPKTYVTRKGAIVLFATQNGKNNDKERNRTDENAQDDSLAKDSPSFKTDNPSQNGPQTEVSDFKPSSSPSFKAIVN